MSEVAEIPELLALGLHLDAGLRTAHVLTTVQLRAHSRGQIRVPETINSRTHKPERDGLFCARVFGPIEDFTCICGKYAGEDHRGTTCDRCGVEVLPTAVRSERFGHIELAAPVVHPLCKGYVARLLQLSAGQLDQVLTGSIGLDARGRPISGDGDEITQIGGHAVREALARVDVSAMDADSELAALGRYLTPAQLMIDVVLVLPAGLRPLESSGNRKAPLDDLNELYRRVVLRNNRLHRLIELSAPLIILHNEYMHLQLTVEQLMCNERTAEPLRHRRHDLRSLAARADERLRALHHAAGRPGTPATVAELLGSRPEADAPPPIVRAYADGESDDDF